MPGSLAANPTLPKLRLLPWFIAGVAMLLVVVMGFGIIVLVISNKSNTSSFNANGSNYNRNASTERQASPAPSLAPVSVSGTTWAGTDSTNAKVEYTFTPNGLVGNRPENTWQQTGNTVVWDVNNKYAHYEGIIIGDRIEFKARNRVDFSWTGTLTRIR
jgi:hypothetical protein